MNDRRAIGGYFEFELEAGVELHKEALALNSARNCLKACAYCTKSVNGMLSSN